MEAGQKRRPTMVRATDYPEQYQAFERVVNTYVR
jgi:hypothetical protein